MRVTLFIRTSIALVIMGTMLPFLVFSGLLGYRSGANKQELIAGAVPNAAQGVAGDLNRQAAALQSLMLALADSRLLQTITVLRSMSRSKRPFRLVATISLPMS